MKDYEELNAIREAMKQELREAEQRAKELRRRIQDFDRGGVPESAAGDMEPKEKRPTGGGLNAG